MYAFYQLILKVLIKEVILICFIYVKSRVSEGNRQSIKGYSQEIHAMALRIWAASCWGWQENWATDRHVAGRHLHSPYLCHVGHFPLGVFVAESEHIQTRIWIFSDYTEEFGGILFYQVELNILRWQASWGRPYVYYSNMTGRVSQIC